MRPALYFFSLIIAAMSFLEPLASGASLVCGSVTDTYKDVPARYNGTNHDDSCVTAKGPDGWQWHCVEYIRRFYRLRKGIDTTAWDGEGDGKHYVPRASKFGLTAFKNISPLTSDRREAATFPPEPDDIIGFSGGKYGHVAIVKEVIDAGGTQFAVRVIEQNFSKTINQLLPVHRYPDGTYYMPARGKYKVQGWLRAGPVPVFNTYGPSNATGSPTYCVGHSAPCGVIAVPFSPDRSVTLSSITVAATYNSGFSFRISIAVYNDASGVPGAELESWNGLFADFKFGTVTSGVKPLLEKGKKYWLLMSHEPDGFGGGSYAWHSGSPGIAGTVYSYTPQFVSVGTTLAAFRVEGRPPAP